jgi:hypothetical protein
LKNEPHSRARSSETSDTEWDTRGAELSGQPEGGKRSEKTESRVTEIHYLKAPVITANYKAC